MDYEKKYKALVEAVKRLQEANQSDEGIQNWVNDNVPELKEDERIKKSLIDYFNRFKSSDMWNESFSFGDVVSWIEKQGKQKPIDKIQLGKKYKCIASPRYSAFMIGEIYKPEDKFLCDLMNFCYDCFEPIEDGEQKPAELPKGEDYGIDGLWHAINILRRTLGEVEGYQSDDGILEHKCAISAVKELYERKPSWSEEDERILNGLIGSLARIGANTRTDSTSINYTFSREIDWLKSLKDRVQ